MSDPRALDAAAIRLHNEPALIPRLMTEARQLAGHIRQHHPAGHIAIDTDMADGILRAQAQPAGSPAQLLEVERLRDVIGKALSSDEAQKIMNTDYTHNLESVGVAMHNFATALGDAAAVAPALGKLADGFNVLAKVASAHPEIAKGITFGGFGGAAVLGAAGAYKIGSAVMDGFGLKGSAVALTGSAEALTLAAGRLAAGGAAGTVERAIAGPAGKAAGAIGIMGAAARSVPIVAATVGLTKLSMTPDAHTGDDIAASGETGKALADWLFPKKAPAGGSAMFGPSRHWEQGTPSGRGRAATPGGWAMGSDAADAAKTAVKGIVDGFKGGGFQPAGATAGKETTIGFLSAGFSAAGAAAAAQVMGALQGAIKGMPAPVAAPTTGAAAAVGKQSAVILDGKKVGALITKRQTQMAALPNAIGGHDSYGSYYPAGGTAAAA